MSVSSEELKQFTCEFSRMVDEGQSIVRCLAALSERQASEEFRQAIDEVNQDVQIGHTLSGAIRKHPSVFGPEYADRVRQGEINANLDEVLQELCSP